MQWCPVVRILQIYLGFIREQKLSNKCTFLWIFTKQIHYKVEWRLVITVCLVDISAFLN